MNAFTLMKSICICVCMLAATVSARAGGPAQKPNIIIILGDDQGWGDLSSNGNTNLKTPHIDSLGRNGAMLDRFYVCPVCAPTRAEMLTGRYHPRTGVRGVSTGFERMNLDERTLAQILRAAGYRTGAFGKWHNGSQWPYHPNARGFEDYYGFTSGHWGEYFDPPLEHNGRPVRGKGYIADDFTDKALAFIEKQRAGPFFCYLAFNTPHSPFCVPDEYWDRFKDKPIALRAGQGDKEDLAVTRCVLAMCENIDWNVGRVLRKLDELKLADNTIVIYFSDNGPNSFRWNGGMKGRKASTDEGGVRSPFLMRWPGRIKGGTTVREIAGAIDLLPTLTSLAKVPFEAGKPLDGKDLSSLLLGGKNDWPDRMIFSTIGGKVSVRTQQYRLDAAGALFDMSADPGQKTDIAAKEPKRTQQLRQAAADFRKEVLISKTDERPYPVGYAEFPTTWLPARDGVAKGDVRRSSGAPNCSYFVNWTKRDDAMTWDIDVNSAGTYEAVIHYACPAADLGSTVELKFKNDKTVGKVTVAWDPPLLDKQDRVARKGESFMKEFRTLSLGRLQLEKGRGLLTLRALEIPGREVMQVRAVTLTLVNGKTSR
jgi:arylsulfatase A-like enzyme